ncbi:hypothetical protein C8J56DRAFT_786389, partial [Mycena floridula]
FTAIQSLYPSEGCCANHSCQRFGTGAQLKKAEQRQAILYTLDDGALPVWSVHLYCDACHTNYHHNFSVKDGTATYYHSVPDILQIGEHRFASRKVVEVWVNLMVISWTSATNCARFYNTSLMGTSEPPEDWKFTFPLKLDHVWEGFLLLSLLEHHEPCGTQLIVPHTRECKDRYLVAMHERNQHIRHYSQPELMHYCDKCVRFYRDDDGNGDALSYCSAF